MISSSKKALPSKAQIKWQDMELGIFAHFGINTFHDKEWSDGSLPAESFNPVNLDARQWIRIAKDAGFQYFILTAKHHDGFCLWQTATTDYSVKSAKWKNGKGDVVSECVHACAEYGMKFGIYLSPWDRHEPCYKDKERYDKFYLAQLEELMTGYGDIFEVWFDGAGSEGREYDWQSIIKLVRQYHPNAMIFNMGTPTIRWVGNEAGIAPYPCPCEAKTARVSMFTNDMLRWSPDTPLWVPAECDVSLHGAEWFWNETNPQKNRSLKELQYIYKCSVGRGANLLLNLPPNRDGLISKSDEEEIMAFGAWINSLYANKIGSISGEGDEFILRFDRFYELSHLIIAEDITFGENIQGYQITANIRGGNNIVISKGSTIGHKKIDDISGVCANEIKLTITKKTDDIHLKSFSVFV